MPDANYPSLTFSNITSLPSGFTLLFTTSSIYGTLGDIIVMTNGIDISHEESGGVTTFICDGITLTYNGDLSSGLTTIGIVYNASESLLKLFVGGELVDSQEYIKGSIDASDISLQGTKEWNVSDFRVYSKSISNGAIEYYNFDALGVGLATGRLG